MYLLAKFDDRRSYKNGDINSYIKSYKNTLQKAELTASIRHIAIFLKPENRFTIPTSRIREEEEELRQLQSVMRSCKRKRWYIVDLIKK